MKIPSTSPELKKEAMQFQSPQPMCDQKRPKKNETFIGLSPFPVIVTTRIVSCLVGDSYKASFTTITGKGDNPRHSLQILFKAGHPLLSLHTEISTGMARDIRCMPSTIQSGRPGSTDHMGIHEWFFSAKLI